MKKSFRVRFFIVGIMVPAFLLANTPIAFGAENLLQNPSVETGGALPDAWFQGGWGTNTAQFTYPAQINGTSAVRVDVTSFESGDAKWYPEEVPVKPETTYVFSDTYIADVATSYDIQYRTASGELSYIFLGAAPVAETPTHSSFTFTTPPDAVALTIFHLIDSVGSLATNAFSLVEQVPPTAETPVVPAPTEPETSASRAMVTLAMDDGFKSVFELAFPILEARGLPSTQYISSGLLNTPGHMTTEDMLLMQAYGHEIGSHTKTHPDLALISAEEAREEIEGSRNDLLAMGATSVETFTYPFGSFNDMTKQMVRDAGFIGARSVNAGFNTSESDRYALLDQHVESHVPIEQIKQWIDQAINDETWLILEFHHQQYDCGSNEYCNTPETLAAIADYLVEKGVRVVTLKEGLDLLGG